MPAEWTFTAIPYPREATLAQLFLEQAACRPAAAAIVEHARVTTYAELRDRAQGLAAQLQSLGIGPDQLVAVCGARSTELIVALVAVVLSGGAYVPLDPEYPPERLAYLLSDIRPAAVLVSTAARDRLPPFSGATVIFDAVERAPTGASYQQPEALRADALAYVMYTSGTTGRPKGVMVPQRAVVRLVRNNPFISIGVDDTFLQAAPLAFDASTLELWGALLNGCRLVLAPPGPLSLVELGQTVRAHRVSILWLTSGLFHAMVADCLPYLSSVRQLLVGGDVLPLGAVRRVLQDLPETRLINGYGPTENTTFTCCHQLTQADGENGVLPIGRPIANTSVHLLDEHLKPVAVGATGELYTGGDGLARGYLNAPDLTADRFIEHPLAAGGRLYRTGDLARWLPSGVLEFVSRADRQVKIRGHRVEPGEVERAIEAHPAVAATCVEPQDRGERGKRLVAFVVATPSLDAGGLEDFLRQRLPGYMIPDAFVFVPALPLNPNGKVDRSALREIDPAAPPEPPQHQSRLEMQIAAVWAELLQVRSVPANVNFFDLGGDSLLVAQVQVRLQALLNRELPITDLFAHPTVRGLATHLSAPAATPAADPVHERARRQRAATMNHRARFSL